MKVKISFELNLMGTNYNINNKSEINACVENLCDWLGELRVISREKQIDLIASLPDGPATDTQMAMLKAIEDEIILGKDIFKNISFQGKTEDGHEFNVGGKWVGDGVKNETNS